jgi:myo-inositol 2-dehydrogenase/D-chiro-inositol 1-dehydrogenase
VETIACCDTDMKSAAAYRQLAGFARSYSDWEQMINAENPDAVILTTPFSITDFIAAKLLTRGIPTLIEKPPADQMSKFLALLETARRTHTPHQVAFNRRNMPLVASLRRHLGQEPIRFIESAMHRVDRRENYFYATAIHDLDLACYLAQSPVAAMTARYPEVLPGVINAHFLVEFQSGAVASLNFCPTSGVLSENLSISTLNGFFNLDMPAWGACPGSLEIYREGERVARITDEDFPEGNEMFITNGFYHQLQIFFSSLLEGKDPPHPLDSCLDSMRLAQCMAQRQKSWTPSMV